MSRLKNLFRFSDKILLHLEKDYFGWSKKKRGSFFNRFKSGIRLIEAFQKNYRES